MIQRVIDINCDVGESADRHQLAVDAALMNVATSVNIACGGHAGDVTTMRDTIRLAVDRGLAIGAHPGYPDRENFGRVSMRLPQSAVRNHIAQQVAAMARLLGEHHAPLHHVKLHGALYHEAMADRRIAVAVADVVAELDPGAILVGLAGAPALDWWRSLGRPVAAEAFADRRYAPDGSLVSREIPGSVITDAAAAAEQAERIAAGRGVSAADGGLVAVQADTICVHSDTPGAPRVASAVRARLEALGMLIQPLRLATPS